MILAFFTPVLIALGAAVTLLLPLLLRPVRSQSPHYLGLLMLLAIGLGFLAGSASMLPGWWQTFPPPDSTLWILFCWPLFGLLGLWQSLKNRPWWISALLRLLPAACYAWLVLAPMRLQGWSTPGTIVLAIGFGLSLLVLSGLPEQTALQTGSHWLYALIWLLLTAGSAPLFLLGSSALLTQQTVMLASLQLIPIALLIWQPEIPIRGLLTLNTFGLTALWLNACLYTDVKPWSAAILLLALSPLLLRLKPIANLPPRLSRGLILTLTILTLSALVTGLWLTRSQDLYFG